MASTSANNPVTNNFNKHIELVKTNKIKAVVFDVKYKQYTYFYLSN
jgi:hypothetical protein